MKMVTRIVGDIAIIDLDGNLKDPSDLEQFSKMIDDNIAEDHSKILINFEKVDFINSSGLGRLILATKKVDEKKGSLRVMNLQSSLDELFTFTRLKEKIKVYGDEKSALESFKNS